MLPEYWTLPNSLKHKLEEAIKPYRSALPGDSFARMSDYLFDRNGGPSDISYHHQQAVAATLGKKISHILKEEGDGQEFLSRMENIYHHNGSPALVIRNMPSHGESVYLLLALKHIFHKDTFFSISRHRLKESAYQIDLRGRYRDANHDGLHHDGKAYTTPVVFLHGVKHGWDRTPTLLATTEEVLDVMVALERESPSTLSSTTHISDEALRRKIIQLMESPAFLSVQKFEISDKKIPLLKYIKTDEEKPTYMLDLESTISPGAPQEFQDLTLLLKKALRHRDRYKGVVLNPDELLIFDNQLLLHEIGIPKRNVMCSSREIYRVYSDNVVPVAKGIKEPDMWISTEESVLNILGRYAVKERLNILRQPKESSINSGQNL